MRPSPPSWSSLVALYGGSAARLNQIVEATTIDTQATTIKGLEKAKNDKDIEIATLESQLASSQTSLGSAQKAASDENDNTPTWAIAIIAVIGAMFLLVLVSLGILVRR